MHIFNSINRLTENYTEAIDPSNVVESAVKLAEALHKYGPIAIIFAVSAVIVLMLILVAIVSFVILIIKNSKKGDSIFGFSKDIITSFLANNEKREEEKKEEELKMWEECNKQLNELKDKIELTSIQQHEQQQNNPDYYHKDILKSYIDINMALKDASRNCQDKINCDRLAIYVFHNGNKSFHGLPFFKMSCVHEWNRMRINSLRGKSHMNMPLHLFDFVVDLYKDGFFKNLNIEKTKSSDEEDKGILEFVNYSNTEAIYITAIKNNDALCGFICAEFNTPFSPDEVRDESIFKSLNKYAEEARPIICAYSNIMYNDDKNNNTNN